jgi:hypothetical protein
MRSRRQIRQEVEEDFDWRPQTVALDTAVSVRNGAVPE